MIKLAIEHLAPYLPHRLKIKVGHVSTATMTLDETSAKLIRATSVLSVEAYQPLLRPLSDLTKEINHRGETFVPIERLIQELTGGGDGMQLTFYQDGCYFYAYRNGAHCVIPQGKMINKLHSWHFDTQNLIEQDLAISVHDLEFNPYEK